MMPKVGINEAVNPQRNVTTLEVSFWDGFDIVIGGHEEKPGVPH